MPSTSNDLHLQLCVNDLLHPTEKSESLLEALTATQLDGIEKTLNKIKMKKQSSPKPAGNKNMTHKPSTCQLNLSIATSSPVTPQLLHHDWTLVAAQIAKALAETMSSSITASKSKTKPPSPATIESVSDKSRSCSPSVAEATDSTDTIDTASITNHEPRTEIREGVEWVSFVYSHHRILRRYSIRTDIDNIDLTQLEESFKNENCVYPRANLPREEYKGNRWAYETECNTLGWKLAYLNVSEIAGKRGLIQRAVDSYRNRYPSMRSRRVARQEKLLKGTLRKRKQRESEEPDEERSKRTELDLPKTVSIDDGLGQYKCKIRMNVDSISLDSIDMEFRKSNCVYPRAMEINTKSPFASQRQLEEVRCNELAWKLAWLNPKQLANRKNLLQRVLDMYRSKFMPELNPRRKNSLLTTTSDSGKFKPTRRKSHDDNESLYSTTDSMDDCLSPSTEFHGDSARTISLNDLMLPGPTTATCSNEFLFEQSVFEPATDRQQQSCRLSACSTSSSNGFNFLSPKKEQIDLNENFSKDSSSIFDLYTNPSAYEQSEYVKTEEDL
ncbi:hypothetical protein CU098_010246 [Rhizopus stolonifer]|uniref:DUF8032 domain-containing protein n=1 Tax=Rhizopus stolonifer TaxID=4846 RepID=A0A367KWK5_RHIST|nr:hypothetical protein CU098_010246 [Rhizopus stolonifer]